MKKIILMIIMAAGILVNHTTAQKPASKVVCFQSSMDCANCEKTLMEHLRFEKGVKDLKIDHVSNTIMIEYKEGKNNDEGFAKAIEKKGYKADKITVDKYKTLVDKVKIAEPHHGAGVNGEKK